MTVPIPLLLTVLIMAATHHLCAWPWHGRTLCLVPLSQPLDPRQRLRVRLLLLANLAVTSLSVTALWLAPTGARVWVATCLPLTVTVGLIAMMIAAQRQQPDNRTGRYAVPLEDPPGPRAYVSPALQLAHGVLLVSSAGVFAALLEQLPERVPMHWNHLGQPDRYAEPSTLWGLGGVIAFDWLLSLSIATGVARERWALPPDESTHARYIALQLRRRNLIVRLAEAITLSCNAGLALMWLGIAFGTARGDAQLTNIVVMVSVIVMSVGILLPLALLLGKSARVQGELRELAGSSVLGTREHGWRWGGLLYFAPDDPAVFVPKRLGIGQTLNFGRPGAWVFLVVVVLAPLLVMWLAGGAHGL